MAETFIISAAVVALNGLIPQAEQLISLDWGFKGDLAQLQDILTIIQDLLRDAENSGLESAALRMWLEGLRPAICGAENVLDELEYEALRRKIELRNRIGNKVRNFFSLSNPLAFRLKLGHKLKHVNYKLKHVNLVLKEIYRQVTVFARLPSHYHGDAVQPREFQRFSWPFVGQSVVGRDRDVSIVRDMLLGSDVEDDLSVVAIVGLPGLGKTTLAQLIYNDEQVVENFRPNRTWACAYDDFNVDKVLNKMMQSLTGEMQSLTGEMQSIVNTEGMVRRIRKELDGKKYLLVLDGIWNINANKWVDMTNCLRGIGGSRGSKILVTTCTMEVVSTMRTSPSLMHNLDELSGDDSWTMFQKRALANGGPRETQTLVEIGRRIVEKCKGFPLLISLVASLLNSKHHEKEWGSIENNETWSSVLNEIGFLKLLRTSFDRLPSPYLKRCFAYCSAFPKGSVIKKDELIQLWMNLGYLHPPLRSHLEMEDVGNDYFDTLLSYLLFQDVEKDEYNNTTRCKMHDHVHDLALHISEGHCVTSEPIESKSHSEVQHLSLDFWEETSLEFRKRNLGKLRTHLPKMVSDINCTLALGLFGDDVEELPTSICKLIRLRYLDLSETSIGKLPNLIAKLYNLQTLKLPTDLLELPKDFHKLVSLRHFCLADTKKTRRLMPMKIGQLTCLQTLPFFVVGDSNGRRIEELGSLRKLRGRLHVYSLQHVKDIEEAKKANISAKSGIQELGFHWDYEATNTINQEGVLEGLQPNRNIRGLILENFGGKNFPSWMIRIDAPLLPNLVKIELRNCSLCEQLPSLGHLLCLEIIEIVRLGNLKRIGPEFCGYNDGGALEAVAFPALRKLSLDDVPMLEEWSLPAVTSKTVLFPHLEELCFSGCPKLIAIPCHLLSIQELTISSINLSSSESGKRCQRCLTICPTYLDSENMEVLMEDLLGKSSLSLRNLTIRGLNSLCYLPNKLWNLVYLEKLEIFECSNLTFDTKRREGFNSLKSLQQVSIKQCENLRCLPEGLLQETLVTLELDSCLNVKIAELHSLKSLVNLTIRGCPSLVSSWEDPLFSPTMLQRLEIGDFPEDLQSFPWPFPSAAASAANANVGVDIQYCLRCGNSLSCPCSSTSTAAAKQPLQFSFMYLRSLHLWGWAKLSHLPEGLRHLTTLRELSIHSFQLLHALPDWLADISSLQSLELYSCKNLTSFPKERLAFLLYLTVENCPLLRRRCKRGVGPEWHKIAHIPSVNISFSAQAYT